MYRGFLLCCLSIPSFFLHVRNYTLYSSCRLPIFDSSPVYQSVCSYTLVARIMRKHRREQHHSNFYKTQIAEEKVPHAFDVGDCAKCSRRPERVQCFSLISANLPEFLRACGNEPPLATVAWKLPFLFKRFVSTRKAHAGVQLLLYRARKLCRQAATLSIHILYKGAQQTVHYVPHLDSSHVTSAQTEAAPH